MLAKYKSCKQEFQGGAWAAPEGLDKNTNTIIKAEHKCHKAIENSPVL